MASDQPARGNAATRHVVSHRPSAMSASCSTTSEIELENYNAAGEFGGQRGPSLRRTQGRVASGEFDMRNTQRGTLMGSRRSEFTATTGTSRRAPLMSTVVTEAAARRCGEGRQVEQLLDYDLDRLVEGCGFLDTVISGAGVLRLNGPFLVYRVLGVLVTSLATCWLCHVFLRDGLLVDKTQWRLVKMSERFQVMTTFLLSTFVVTHVGRWRAHRDNLTQMQSSAANVVTTCAAQGVHQRHLRRLIRLCIAAQWLLFRESAAGPDGRGIEVLEDVDHEPDVGLTPNEVKTLLEVRWQAQAVWTWIQIFLRELRASGELKCDGPSMARLETQCGTAIRAMQTIEAQISTKVPLIYAQLLVCLVEISAFVLGVSAGARLAEAFESLLSDLNNVEQPLAPGRTPWYQISYEFFTALPTIIGACVAPIVFVSLLTVCHHIDNPFGLRPLDFHQTYLLCKLTSLLECFVDSERFCLPSDFPPLDPLIQSPAVAAPSPATAVPQSVRRSSARASQESGISLYGEISQLRGVDPDSPGSSRSSESPGDTHEF